MNKIKKSVGLLALIFLIGGVTIFAYKAFSEIGFQRNEQVDSKSSDLGVISYGFGAREEASKVAGKIADLSDLAHETAVGHGIVDGVILGVGEVGIHAPILDSAKKMDWNNGKADLMFDHIVMRLQVELYERDLLSPNDSLGVYDLYETIPINENERSLLTTGGSFPASAWAEVVFRYVYDNGARVHTKDQSGRIIAVGDLDSSVELYYKLKFEVKACVGKDEMADCGPYVLIYELQKGRPLLATTVLKPKE